MAEFVPPDFEVPLGLTTSDFVLEPLGPEHNEQDFEAWTSAMEHIAETPGFPWGSWPREMTPEKNREDLERHADDFRNRKGFTYTVLDPADRDVIGCVYIYPVRDSDDTAIVKSWVRKSHARLDAPLWRAVTEWLESDWPFTAVQYAPRGQASRSSPRRTAAASLRKRPRRVDAIERSGHEPPRGARGRPRSPAREAPLLRARSAASRAVYWTAASPSRCRTSAKKSGSGLTR